MFKTCARLLVLLLAGVGFLVVVVSATPLVQWWGRALAGPWTDPRGDVLIVLGGSQESETIMGESSYRRAVYAVLAVREGTFHRVVLSGGGDPSAVGALMREFLVCHGVPADTIVVESESRTTLENALNTARLLRGLPGRKVLMTSDYHMTRAHGAFAKAGLHVEPRPFPDAIKRGATIRGRWSAFVDVASETVALGYYLARGWI